MFYETISSLWVLAVVGKIYGFLRQVCVEADMIASDVHVALQ